MPLLSIIVSSGCSIIDLLYYHVIYCRLLLLLLSLLLLLLLLLLSLLLSLSLLLLLLFKCYIITSPGQGWL
jgi:hypothetical protein